MKILVKIILIEIKYVTHTIQDRLFLSIGMENIVLLLITASKVTTIWVIITLCVCAYFHKMSPFAINFCVFIIPLASVNASVCCIMNLLIVNHLLLLSLYMGFLISGITQRPAWESHTVEVFLDLKRD